MRLLLFAHKREAASFLAHYSWEKIPQINNLYLCKKHKLLLLITGMDELSIQSKFDQTLGLFPTIVDLINLGICGQLNQQNSLPSLVSPQSVFFNDDNNRGEYSLFTLPTFKAVKCLSSSCPITEAKLAAELSQRADIVDMELWFLAQIASRSNKRLSSIKLISDHADQVLEKKFIEEKSKKWSKTLLDGYLQARELHQNAK